MAYATLQDLTTAITAFCDDHAQVQMNHWGVISDISTPKDGVPPAYPYTFWILDQTNFTRRQYLLNITGIFQTRCKDEELEILKAQSDMLDIARDVYAYFTIQDGDGPSWGIARDSEVTGMPFVERFQDTVAGVTVNFQFEIDVPVSKCYIPTKA